MLRETSPATAAVRIRAFLDAIDYSRWANAGYDVDPGSGLTVVGYALNARGDVLPLYLEDIVAILESRSHAGSTRDHG